VGIERTSQNAGKTQGEHADSAPYSAFPADLRRVIDAWPRLCDDARRAILAVVDNAPGR
jgi:hypothetical protein